MSEHVIKEHRRRSISYTVGFLLSLVLTIIPYLLITRSTVTGTGAVLVLVGFAVAQLFVQLTFFLHLNNESRPRWNFMSVVFAAIVVFILVIGSMWIMYNLDYNMSQDKNIDQKIIKEEGFAQ